MSSASHSLRMADLIATLGDRFAVTEMNHCVCPGCCATEANREEFALHNRIVGDRQPESGESCSFCGSKFTQAVHGSQA